MTASGFVRKGSRLAIVLRDAAVSSPEGERWQVGRRWMDKPLPDPRGLFRRDRDESLANAGIETLNAIDLMDSPVAALAIAAAALLIFLVLLPLIGFALELLLVLLVIWSGIAARLFLGRPWIVEAVNLDDASRSAAFPVKGWRGSGRAVEELKRSIVTSGTPALPASE